MLKGEKYLLMGNALRATRSVESSGITRRRLYGSTMVTQKAALQVDNSDQNNGIRATSEIKTMMYKFEGSYPETWCPKEELRRWILAKAGNNPGGAGAPAGVVYPNIVSSNGIPPLIDVYYPTGVAVADDATPNKNGGAWATSLTANWTQESAKVTVSANFEVEYVTGTAAPDLTTIAFAGADLSPSQGLMTTTDFTIGVYKLINGVASATNELSEACGLIAAGFTISESSDPRLCAGSAAGPATATYYGGAQDVSVTLQTLTDVWPPDIPAYYCLYYNFGGMHVIMPKVSFGELPYGESKELVTFALTGKAMDYSSSALVASAKQFIWYATGAA